MNPACLPSTSDPAAWLRRLALWLLLVAGAITLPVAPAWAAEGHAAHAASADTTDTADTAAAACPGRAMGHRALPTSAAADPRTATPGSDGARAEAPPCPCDGPDRDCSTTCSAACVAGCLLALPAATPATPQPPAARSGRTPVAQPLGTLAGPPDGPPPKA